MITFNHLTYTYPDAPRPALEDVSLQIDDGEFVLVTGLSGSGKSTLLRCLNGLVPHFTGGRVTGRLDVAGHDPVSEGPHTLSRFVGFVFQNPEAQFVLDRVEDEIAFALENSGLPPAEMRLRVEEVLDLLGLAHLRDRPLETLSGGEKQRVAIAAALVLRPRVLVLDEPTSQLDPQSAEEVLQALISLNRDLGLTVVLAEQRLERILSHTDRLIYLPLPHGGAPNGSRVLSGSPRELLQHMGLVPPLVALGKALAWDPLPLTVKEGRVHTRGMPAHAARRASAHKQNGEHGEPLLRVQDIQFAYNGALVLRGLSLSVGAGELVTLMGRNGSGKTTLLRCIAGLQRPRQGTIELAGQSLMGRETAEICQDVGYLPQDPDALLFADSVRDELNITLRNHGLQDHPPIPPARLLVRLDLQDVEDAYPRDLSVGQRQRVALGAVAVTRPRLLILDEPTRGMDYRAKQELVRMLREWQAEGTGILLVTHDVELAATAADRVVVLSQGEAIADASPREVLASSPLFAPQIARLFPDSGWLTLEDALEELAPDA